MWLCVKSTHLHPFAVLFEQILSDENKEFLIK